MVLYLNMQVFGAFFYLFYSINYSGKCFLPVFQETVAICRTSSEWPFEVLVELKQREDKVLDGICYFCDMYAAGGRIPKLEILL